MTEKRPPRVNVFRDWTPDMLRSAEQSAESGNLMQAVAICEWLLTDNAVLGALGSRTDALLGLPVSFVPGDVPDALVESALRRDFPKQYTEAELTQIVDYGILLGVGLGRHNITADDFTDRWLMGLEFWLPSTLSQDQQTGEWTVRDAAGATHKVEAGDGSWVLHTPYGKNRPWARGRWRALCRLCLLKQLAQQDWARHSEIAARLVAETQLDKDGHAPPTTEAQRQQIVSELLDAGSEAAIALPPGWTLRLLEISANTEAIYKAQIAFADEAIRILIRGGDLSSKAGEGGSFAAAESQYESNEAPKRRYDGEALSTTLHDQSIVIWSEYNFGSRAVAPYPKWSPVQDVDVSGLAPLASALKTLDEMGAVFELEILRERYGLDFVKAFDESRRKAAPAPGGFGFGAPAPGTATPVAEQAPAESPDEGKQADATKFADKLAAEAAAAAERASADFVKVLRDVVEAATGPEDLERRLKAAFADADTAELEALTEKAYLVAELAGRYAVLTEL